MIQTDLPKVYREIEKTILTHSASVESASFVGSAAPQSGEPNKIGCDLDLVVLSTQRDSAELLMELRDSLTSLDPPWIVVDDWDIVSPSIAGFPIVHLHSASVAEYYDASSLFRRSVGKYVPICGTPLDRYCPCTPLSRGELLDDSLGPVKLLRRLELGLFASGGRIVILGHDRTRNNPQLAAPVDYIFYSVLHSVRNTLRTIWEYKEFSSIEELPKQWLHAGGPHTAALARLVELKQCRRAGTRLPVKAQNEAHADAVQILRSIREFVNSAERV
jgi:hypothetical protein